MNGPYVGFDIGGTKCAVIIGENTGQLPRILTRHAFPTPPTLQECMSRMCELARKECKYAQIHGIGISAGNPMDAKNGMLLNPPNLPGWSGISLTQWATDALHAPAMLENDANACALAEWRWGAGIGYTNMIFLTFGTGMGAGLILNGALYRGTLGNAGEIGHIRLQEFGPSGYGKLGSFEGFCSGGGLPQLAETIGLGYRQRGIIPAYMQDNTYDVKALAEAARAQDTAAIEVFTLCGHMLGKGLAVLVDILNPECIVIGSIYTRCTDLLKPAMQEVLEAEALSDSVSACSILPAKLGEQIGDFAALSVAIQAHI